MIISGILDVLYTFIYYIIGLLPNADSTITAEITSFVTNFRTYLAQANWFVNVNHILLLFSIVITIETGIFLWRGIKFAAHVLTLGQFNR